ncbi:MAG: hypothetical protein R3E10_11570 [Gemmatimonadota bacterium]
MPPSFLTRLVRTGLLLGLVDGTWALVLTAFYGRPPFSVFRGVAATVFGPEMMEAGARGALIGLTMHFLVAFTWSLVFIALETRSAWLRRLLATTRGTLAVGAVLGPLIWLVMSGVVIPVFTGNPLAATKRWLIQLVGHAVFVGQPIVWAARRPLSNSSSGGAHAHTP